MSEVKKDAEVTATVPKEEYDKVVKERDEIRNAFEVNGRNAQAIIEEKSILISVLVEKIKSMTRQ